MQKRRLEKNDIRGILLAFIRNEFGVDDRGFSADSNLFEDGYVDSIRLESFFAFLENSFELTFQERYFFDERISTITGIAEIIIEIEGEL